MKKQYEVILAGAGGQGLIVCGIMLAEAAVLEGKNVVQTQSYGIASRGGFSQSEVIISEEEIIFQQVQAPDLILALTQAAFERYAPLAAHAPLFFDTTLVKTGPGQNLYGYPFLTLASELGHEGMANIIALGAMAALTGMVRPESLAQVLRRRFAGQTAEMNVKALYTGCELIKKDQA
ncbi:MAG: 2-oxoacid:acceptor oxidoreductase family protein [Clostridia bacterium]|nr:2-oxoacid:acceptor oxidoreductase family protein [Clostridia bacterium]